MQSLSLAEATLHDLDLIMEMESAGFAKGNRELREAYELRIKAFAQGSLMAYRGDACVGCIFSEIWKASPTPLAKDFELGHNILDRHDALHGTELYISSMTINPAFRGQGLGGQLFDGCIKHVSGIYPQLNSAILLVNETWPQARKIYTAAGFSEVTRFKDFFNPDGITHQDGIVMRRSIAHVE